MKPTSLLLLWKIWLTHPRDALCDWGIWGCPLHIRSKWFTPLRLVRALGFYRDYEPED